MAPLTVDEVVAALVELPAWSYDDGHIVREYTFPAGFMSAIGFVNRLAAAAESADHHPDLLIRWNRVTVTLRTHSEQGITTRDILLAAEADQLASAVLRDGG